MRALRRSIKRFGLGRIIGLLSLVAWLVVRLWDPTPLEALRHKVFDVYQLMLPRQAPADGVTIVDLDEASLKAYGQWPWPRTLVADLVTRINRAGAAVIGFDVLFPEPDRTSPRLVADSAAGIDAATREALRKLPDNDVILAAAVAPARVVLGQSGFRALEVGIAAPTPAQTGLVVVGEDPRPSLISFPHLLSNVPVIEAAAKGRGLFSIKPESDGVIRRLPLIANANGVVVPSLTLDMLRVAAEGGAIVVRSDVTGIVTVGVQDLDLPTDRRGQAWLHFSPHDPARFVPAVAVLEGRAPAERFKDRLVLIGTSAIGLLDLKTTPIDAAMPGVELHAQALDSMLSGTLLKRPIWSTATEYAAAVALSLILIAIGPAVGAGTLFFLGGVVAMTTVGLSWFAFASLKFLADATFPLAASFTIYLVMVWTNYLQASADRQRIRSAFSQYISPALVDELARSPEKLVLGGERRDMTVMFSDVRGFTAVSETYKDDPQGLTALLTRLLTPLTNCVIGHKGTIDKYMGDGIMAFWNAPLTDTTHEANAAQAALGMLESLAVLNAQRAAELPDDPVAQRPLRIGIGLNTGPCFVGNFGSDLHFNYSVLGDTVNVSSRLEGQSKAYGVPIIAGSRMALAVERDFAVFELDLIQVVGKSEPEQVFTILGGAETRASPAFVTLSGLNRRMLGAYRNREWTAALEAILLCREFAKGFGLDDYYALFVARIRAMSDHPPPAEWRGVTVLETK